MKLHELHEESIGELNARWTPNKISDDEIIAWIKERSPKFLSKGKSIFRGTGPGLTGVLDTTVLKRDAGHSNHGFYNLWIDNDEMWEEFPKRAQSIICTTRDHVAHDYGDGVIYLIIPADSAKIGVCPQPDIWLSFNKNGISDINDFFNVISNVMVGGRPRKNDWKTFKLRCERTTLEDISSSENGKVSAKDYIEHYDWGTNFLQRWKKEEHANMYDCLQELLDPYDNGFNVVKPHELDVSRNREIWVSGHEMQVQITGEREGRAGEKVLNFLRHYFQFD